MCVFVVPWCVFVPSRFRRLSCGGAVFTSSALDEFSEWLVMVSKLREKRVLGSRARSDPKECWQMRSRPDGRKEWTCKFCSESNVWTRWRCRRCYSKIPAGFQGKYRQAVAAKAGEWSTGSSTSSGDEDTKAQSLKAENTNFERGLMAWKRRKECKKDRGIPSREGGHSEDVWEGLRKSKMRLRAAEN